MSDAEAALKFLAKRLYWNMQRLDPDIEAPEWDGLTDRERRFYLLLVQDLAQFEARLAQARLACNVGAADA